MPGVPETWSGIGTDEFSYLASRNGAMQSRRGQGRYPRKYGYVVQSMSSTIQSSESKSAIGARGLCEIRLKVCSGRLAQRGSRTIEGGASSSIWNSTPECETEFKSTESDRNRILLCEEILGRRCESSPLHLFVESYSVKKSTELWSLGETRRRQFESVLHYHLLSFLML